MKEGYLIAGFFLAMAAIAAISGTLSGGELITIMAVAGYFIYGQTKYNKVIVY